jgi:AmmeMemoRadiSam system protein B
MNIKRSSSMAWLMAPLVAFLVTAPIRHVDGAGQQKVRLAAVAGAFYPSDPKELSAMIDGMLAQASPPPADGPIVAAVAPHAGYPYSGPVAAWTFAALKGHKYSRVVVIAPSHYVGFDFTSVYDGDAYATPLGTIPVDKEFARQLTKIGSTIRLSEQGHTPTSAGGEHAIEVQLPWLQKVLGNFELVPIVMGDQSYESSRALGVALAKMIQDERKSPNAPGDTLILASSDLSHYHPYGGMGLLQHVAQLSDAHVGGLRRRAHCGRNDLRRTHGSQPGRGAQVRQLRRYVRRSLARGRIQRRPVCERSARSGGGNAFLAH